VSGRHDTVVIGGGPGGLAGALYLARFRRKVLLIDAGESRAARIPRSHNYPGFPGGVVGAELLASMRCQAQQYGAELVAARVEAIRREDGGFAVDGAGIAASGRCVLLASGVDDVAPPMPYLADALRDGALRYCPVCDGYEVIDRAVGLIADSDADLSEALYLRHFTPHLTVFVVAPGVRFGAAQRRRLAAAGIRLEPEPIHAIRLWDGKVTVSHGSGETSCDSVYAALGIRVHSQLATALGAAHDDDGYLVVDAHQQTSVEGLYAAGDVVAGLNQISVAVGTAAQAAAAIHLALLKQDAAA
jgi:thioredoxin reductase (NADPH)